ncbi:RING finger protein 11 [Eurytemora carolleeae]|uniref:RING finger protein 11 n=1 Tax=Eurytemora carolleeae TaxID=1294199 RepID=UPI000C767E27|nr:RING finger protein 11 [Eurytemora carolleeae]|eukprot:XP_023344855.1 RING finger protein 11-like [Eurytemora affinis]
MLAWLRSMGNCLKAPTQDDISLLRDGGNNSVSTERLETSSSYAEENSQTAPVYYPSPNVSRSASQLTEEEQVKIAQRIGLIQHLPTGTFDGCKKNRECVICMIEFNVGDLIRYLPCMHTYHTVCIDDWLMRSFTCPSCMEPVDAALLVAYDSN